MILEPGGRTEAFADRSCGSPCRSAATLPSSGTGVQSGYTRSRDETATG